MVAQRLDRLEATISRCITGIERSNTVPRAPWPMGPLLSSPWSNTCLRVKSCADSDPLRTVGCASSAWVHGSSSSMVSILRHVETASKELLADPTILSTQSFASKVKAACELLQDLCSNKQQEISDSSAQLYLPPRALVEACVERYLTHLNPPMPIFSRESLENAICALYHPMCTSRNPAWLVCFNNITLLTISVQCGFCVDQQSLQQQVAEECLFRSLIANTRQYLDNFQCLLKPCLVNVQALLSLVGFHIFAPL
jgi:hypothetical protein